MSHCSNEHPEMESFHSLLADFQKQTFPKVPWCHFSFSHGPAQTQGVGNAEGTS